MEYSNYLFRCSQIGKLMTGISVGLTDAQEATFNAYDARYKGEGKPLTENQLRDYFELGAKKYGRKVGLSVTTQNFLKELHKETVFGRSKEIKNKYTEKGIQVEDYTLSMYTRVTGCLVLKNKVRLNNEFLTGELDNNDKVKKMLREFKSSWDFSTFPFFETEIPTTDYDWQIDGYLALTGYNDAELIYGLVDTPSKIIDDELRRLDWKHGIFNMEGDVKPECVSLVVEVVSNLIYSKKGLKEFCSMSANVYEEWFKDFKEVPEEQRIKIFHKKRDENRINAIYNQIKLCREYLNNLSKVEVKEAV